MVLQLVFILLNINIHFCEIFLAENFVISIIIRIFAASVPTKPLNDAQMRGAFFFYNSSMLKYMAQVCLESAIFDIGITFYTAKIMFLYKP